MGVPEQPKYMLERIDIIPDLIGEGHIFDDFGTCLEYINKNLVDVV